MALKDSIQIGVSLPHRSPDPIAPAEVQAVARRAEALGFSDLWVTENTLDNVYSFDSMMVLTFAAAATERIGVGVSVMVLPLHNPIHVAHQVASLDYLSGGRAILGVGLGRAQHYEEFGVPLERRVRRLLEGVRLMKALWTQEPAEFEGEIYHLAGARMPLKPVRKPHPPVWFGGTHPDAVARAAAVADGWMGSGNQATAAFAQSVPLLRAALEKAGRDPAAYPISKRIFLSVHEDAATAEMELRRWFGTAYRNPDQALTSGVCGTPGQVREQVEAIAAMGASHLLLNPVCRYEEQVEALADVSGLA